MRLNGTYGDHITLVAISQMYNVPIHLISSLGPQPTVNINQENGRQAMVLRHYAEAQDGHYVCLRSTPHSDCSEYEYEEPISDIDSIQTELDEHTSDMDNIQTELDEHNSDMDNIQTKLDEHNSDTDNIQTELDEYNSDMDNIQTELDEHNSNTDNRLTELDEHNSNIDNIQTELDQHNSDMDNIQAELDECITDIGNARTELMGDMDDVQNELDKYISDNKSNWNLLPNEIWLKIIRALLQQCDFKANHACFTFATLNLVNKRFNELTQKCKDNLPRVYCNPELLPKPKSGRHIVCIQSLIRKFDSFSGAVLEIKRIVNFSRWNSAWFVLIPDTHLWLIVLNIFWKNRKRP